MIKVKLRFLYSPEFLKEGASLIINEDNFQAMGKVVHISYDKREEVKEVPKKKGKRTGFLPEVEGFD